MQLSDNKQSNKSLRLKNIIGIQHGFAMPTVLIFVALFFATPILYLIFNPTKGNQEQVKGSSTSVNASTGLYVQVTSSNGGWELSEILCKDLEECKSDNKGKKWQSLNGGQTEANTIKIDYSEMFSTYNYLKLFVKPGWNSGGRDFNVTISGDNTNINSGQIKDNVGTFGYVIVPLEDLKANKHMFISFTDK